MLAIIGFLIAIFFIYRCIRLVKMLLMPSFWLGAALIVAFVIVTSIVFNSSDASTGDGTMQFFLITAVLFILTVMIVKPMRLPVYFILGIISLGLFVANIALDSDDSLAGSTDYSSTNGGDLAQAAADPSLHDVKPHWVNGYVRDDGTYVNGYWRDGDGNPATTLTSSEGGGYLRSNPDSNPLNNLKKN